MLARTSASWAHRADRRASMSCAAPVGAVAQSARDDDGAQARRGGGEPRRKVRQPAALALDRGVASTATSTWSPSRSARAFEAADVRRQRDRPSSTASHATSASLEPARRSPLLCSCARLSSERRCRASCLFVKSAHQALATPHPIRVADRWRGERRWRRASCLSLALPLRPPRPLALAPPADSTQSSHVSSSVCHHRRRRRRRHQLGGKARPGRLRRPRCVGQPPPISSLQHDLEVLMPRPALFSPLLRTHSVSQSSRRTTSPAADAPSSPIRPASTASTWARRSTSSRACSRRPSPTSAPASTPRASSSSSASRTTASSSPTRRSSR